MSRQTARLVLDQFNMRPALIAERYGRADMLPDVTSVGLIGDVRELATCDYDKEIAANVKRRTALASAYGYEGALNDKPFVFVDGKAIIPVHGMLINRFAYSWSFATGYNFIKAQAEAALNDPDVDGIIYDVNTYGGTVAGCRETADVIYRCSLKGGGKRSLAVVDSNCYSAGYMTMSACDHIAVTPSGGAGSIGVVLMHMDISAALDKAGVKITFITAPEGGQKAAGNAYEPLSKEVLADLQGEIDKMYEVFVSTVVRNRPRLSAQAIRDTEARCFLADDALAAGLIDSVATPPDALNGFFNATDPDDTGDDPDQPVPTEEASTMPETPEQKTAREAAEAAAHTKALNEAAAAARTAERERVKKITTDPEAVGRESLASHFAHETDMTPEAAVAALKASPKAEAPVTQPATQSIDANAPNYFKAAMDNGKNPDVGGNEGTGTEGAGGSDDDKRKARVAAILGAQGRAAPEAARK